MMKVEIELNTLKAAQVGQGVNEGQKEQKKSRKATKKK
jgi:hypothetical protein